MPFFQPKLTINAPGDQYEHEADAMAERVVQAPQSQGPVSGADAVGSVQRQAEDREEEPVQRKCSDCEKEEKERVQRQEKEPEEEPVQRQPEKKEEEKPVQRMPLMRKSAGGGYTATPALSSRLSASKGGGSALPAPTRAHMESAFGADFGQVRIHTDRGAAEMNAGINARAFTHGSDIYFNSGQYAPESGEGKRLLAHELTHVVQQRGDFHVSPKEEKRTSLIWKEDIEKEIEYAYQRIDSKYRELNKYYEMLEDYKKTAEEMNKNIGFMSNFFLALRVLMFAIPARGRKGVLNPLGNARRAVEHLRKNKRLFDTLVARKTAEKYTGEKFIIMMDLKGEGIVDKIDEILKKIDNEYKTIIELEKYL